MTILRTARLTLRPLTLDDLPAVVAWRNDPEIARFQGWDLPVTLENARGLISDGPLGSPGWVQRAIVLQNGMLLVDVGLNTEGRQAEIGVTLRSHSQWRGYAAEALRGLIRHTFGDLHLHRLHASADPRNVRVVRLLTGLGFRHEGTSIQSYWQRGEWTDDARFGLLASEWVMQLRSIR